VPAAGAIAAKNHQASFFAFFASLQEKTAGVPPKDAKLQRGSSKVMVSI